MPTVSCLSATTFRLRFACLLSAAAAAAPPPRSSSHSVLMMSYFRFRWQNDLIHRLKLVHATLTPTDDQEIDVTSPEYPSLDSLTQYLVSNKLLSSKDKEVSKKLLLVFGVCGGRGLCCVAVAFVSLCGTFIDNSVIVSLHSSVEWDSCRFPIAPRTLLRTLTHAPLRSVTPTSHCFRSAFTRPSRASSSSTSTLLSRLGMPGRSFRSSSRSTRSSAT